jgi:hypothetical protein
MDFLSSVRDLKPVHTIITRATALLKLDIRTYIQYVGRDARQCVFGPAAHLDEANHRLKERWASQT